MNVLPDGWENKPRAFSYDIMMAKMHASRFIWTCVWISLAASVVVQLTSSHFGVPDLLPWWFSIPTSTVICSLGGTVIGLRARRDCIRDILAAQRAADLAKQPAARGLQ